MLDLLMFKPDSTCRVRASLEEAVADRKDLVAIKKRGLADLEAFLLQIHPPS